MPRTCVRQGVMESTISSPTRPALFELANRGSAVTERTMHSVAERTSGRRTAFFCCIDMAFGGKESGTALPVSTDAVTISESPMSAPTIMVPFPSPAESFPHAKSALGSFHMHSKSWGFSTEPGVCCYYATLMHLRHSLCLAPLLASHRQS